MLEKIFIQIAYSFYPKGLDSLIDKDKYLKTKEYLSLKNFLIHNSTKEIKNYFSNINLDKRKFVDATIIDWQDRYFNFQFHRLENNKINTICLKISFLTPYFSVYNLVVDVRNSGKWINYPKINTETDKKM